MERDRTLSWPLLLSAVGVATVLAIAAGRAWLRPDLASAVRQLGDQDCERRERLRLLQVVLDDGLASADPADRLPAAMAAVALGDEDAWQRCLLAGNLPLGDADAARLRGASLGEPVLRELLAAMLAEVRGQGEAARTAYRRVLVQCRTWDLPLAARLARAALQRLG